MPFIPERYETSINNPISFHNYVRFSVALGRDHTTPDEFESATIGRFGFVSEESVLVTSSFTNSFHPD